MTRVRWTCPNGCGSVLGPSKPRRDNICRYCLECSAQMGRLVERTAPALERKRQAKAEASKTRRQTKAQAEAAALTEWHTVGGVDVREVVAQAVRLPALRPAKGVPWTFRRGTRERVTGRGGAYRWILTASPEARTEDVVGTILHELAHVACGRSRENLRDGSPEFGRRVARAIRQWNSRHLDLQVDEAQWGAYRGRWGRRNRRVLAERRAANPPSPPKPLRDLPPVHQDFALCRLRCALAHLLTKRIDP